MALNKKWNNETFDIELEKIHPNWKRIGEVVNGAKSVEVICENGHLIKIQPAKIHQTRICNKCKLEKTRIKNGEKFIKELLNEKYIPLFKAEEYVNYKTKMKVLCPNNNICYLDYGGFKRDKIRCSCDECLKNKPKPKKPIFRTWDECFKELKDKGFIMDESSKENWRGIKNYVKGKWIECGHEDILKPHAVLNKNRKCKECKKWTLDKFKKFLKKENINFIIKENQEFHMKKLLTVICENGHEINIYPQNVVYYGYKCQICSQIMKSGENSHLYSKELSEEERMARTQKYYKRWMRRVKKRDNNTCQLCKTTNKIEAHHYYSFKNYKKIRFDINNGISLCSKCHKDFHDRYGYNDNTIDQFIEYFIDSKYYNEQFLNNLLKTKNILDNKINS